MSLVGDSIPKNALLYKNELALITWASSFAVAPLRGLATTEGGEGRSQNTPGSRPLRPDLAYRS